MQHHRPLVQDGLVRLCVALGLLSFGIRAVHAYAFTAPSPLPYPPSSSAPLLADLVKDYTNLTVLNAFFANTNTSKLLGTPGESYTLFAPLDTAWASALLHGSLTCTSDYYLTQTCTSLRDILTATNLKNILMDHVVGGELSFGDIQGQSSLRCLGGSVRPVELGSDKSLYVGSARIVSSLRAQNGVMHVVGSVLTGDLSINASSLALTERIGDFGPFDNIKREEMFHSSAIAFLPASIDTLVAAYRVIRASVALPDGGVYNPPALGFHPTKLIEANARARGLLRPFVNTSVGWQYPKLTGIKRPADNTTLAFMTVLELGSLLRSKQVTAVELAQLALQRLRRYDSILEHVVTYTDTLAMDQATHADQMFAKGVDVGPLQGIPYGLKDLIAVEGYRTTWGTWAFLDQQLPSAPIYERLRRAGAVLVAKLATGEMAFDDVWWGGKTKNPWNIAEGSSGSSSGPAAAVVSGALPFSLGTETEGSLMAPSERCGATALRPTFGAVSRTGVMSLVDSLDKLGPVCRDMRDCAVVYDLVRGREQQDPTTSDLKLPDPFAMDIQGLTVGILPSAEGWAQELVAVLRAKGVTVKPFSLNYTAPAQEIITLLMMCETAANFDHWQRAGKDDANRRQDFWPPLLRLGRLVPGVEYIQAQRARTRLVQEVVGLLAGSGMDAFISNTTDQLAMANLASLPTAALPISFERLDDTSRRRRVVSAGIFGPPQADSTVMALAMAWQQETSYHRRQPPLDDVEPAVLATCEPYSRCALPPAVLAALPRGQATAPPTTWPALSG